MKYRVKRIQILFIVYMNKDEWLTLIDPMTKEDIWKFYIEDRDYEFEPGVRIHISNLSEALKTYLKWAKNISDLKEKLQVHIEIS